MGGKNETALANTEGNVSHKKAATKTISKTARTTCGAVKKPHPYKRGTIAIQQANNDELSTDLLIHEVPFPGSLTQEDQENCLGLREFLVGFSFGNVDGASNLEEDYFNEGAKPKFNALFQLCPSIVDLQSTELLICDVPLAESVAQEVQENGLSLKEFLIGFSFGNVDDAGNLEEAYFDEDAKDQLKSLSQLCLSIGGLQSTELLNREDPFAGSAAEEDQENGLGLEEFLVGFSISNVDDASDLEATYFDEHSKEHLYALSPLCPSVVGTRLGGEDWQEDYDDAV